MKNNSVIHNPDPKPIEFAWKPTDSLAPSAQNARTHSPQQIEKLTKSISQFGFINPIIIAEDGSVLAGHGRLEAAKALGMETVPTVSAAHLSAAQRRAYMLADNRMAMDAEWDESMLIEQLRALEAEGMDLGFTGFDSDELADLMRFDPVADADEDAVPEATANPVSKLGDIWLLGNHRVRCGDSEDAEGVALLLAGAKPHLMVTDPPYGVEYDADWRNHTGDEGRTGRAVGKVLNDDKADWRKAWALFPGDVAYVWHAGKFAGVVQESLEASGLDIRSQIIWAKNNLAIGRGDYHWKHEPAWYAVREGGKSHWQGSRKETTVWEIDKPQKSETGHSTQKPVECMRRPIVNNSQAGDAVYDPFLGSGTTLIACETEARVCYGSELNPAYVDVIVKRWQEFTGRQATRESDGATFDSLFLSEAA